MSIKENILYGNENASDERVREVAELANATVFIEKEDEDEEDLTNTEA
jgi:ABC-type multidrug transport system fused ATPase/permease subunit